MPVEISLERLVSVVGTRSLWPEKFAALLDTVEQDTEDATAWLVLADWLQEHDEQGLERAARWVGKRNGAGAHDIRPRHLNDPYWLFDPLPPAIKAVFPQQADRRSVAGLLADLAAALRKLDEDAAA